MNNATRNSNLTLRLRSLDFPQLHSGQVARDKSGQALVFPLHPSTSLHFSRDKSLRTSRMEREGHGTPCPYDINRD